MIEVMEGIQVVFQSMDKLFLYGVVGFMALLLLIEKFTHK